MELTTVPRSVSVCAASLSGFCAMICSHSTHDNANTAAARNARDEGNRWVELRYSTPPALIRKKIISALYIWLRANAAVRQATVSNGV